MFEWLSEDASRSKDSETLARVTAGLKYHYESKLLPIERGYIFNKFYSNELTDADFSARPMVLLLGQYSTGKTTFIQRLLGREYPGMRIGPEPTTDNFIVCSYGDTDQFIPGNTLIADTSMPFSQLFFFGKQFLSRLGCAQCSSPVLQGITLIDTPGVFAGEKHRVERGYEFESVAKWFADRADIILLLFDVFKLDISGELCRTILSLRGNGQKIRIVLNKADRLTTPELMRAHGALMWSLRKVVDTPEVPRVYVGSFWDEPLYNEEQRSFFELEEDDLYTILAQLPRGAAVRKINDLLKRGRLAKVHVYLLDALVKRMPVMFGREKEKQKMIQNITTIYKEIAQENALTMGDFPDPRMMQAKLQQHNFSKFKKIDQQLMDLLDELLRKDLPDLLKSMFPEEKQEQDAEVMKLEVADPESFVGETIVKALYLPDHDPAHGAGEVEHIPEKANVSACPARAPVHQRLLSNALRTIFAFSDLSNDGDRNVIMHCIKMKLKEFDPSLALPAYTGAVPNRV